MLVFGLVTRNYFKIWELRLYDLDTRSIEIPQITAAWTVPEDSKTLTTADMGCYNSSVVCAALNVVLKGLSAAGGIFFAGY